MFIVALCASYELRHWRIVLLLITAFTVGHSITLALATFEILTLQESAIEVLIPVTILLTSVGNVVSPGTAHLDAPLQRMSGLKYLLAAVFGLIHGLGFSNFLRSLLGSGRIALPLFGFNVGLEVAQAVVVMAVLGTTALVVGKTQLGLRAWTTFLSCVTGGVSVLLILERVGA